MEIRQKLIDHAKRVARLDENARFRRAWLDKGFYRVPRWAMPRCAFPRGVFEGAHHGRPNGKNRPALAARSANRARRWLGNFIALGMNLMPIDFLFVDGLECAEAD